MEKTKILSKKNQNGISMIALVITIIVLLILTAVTITTVITNEGTFQKADEAVQKTSVAGGKEQVELLMAEILVGYYEKKSDERGNIEDYIYAYIGEGRLTSSGDYYVTAKDGIINVYKGNAVLEEEKVASGEIRSDVDIIWE